ncbi:MAG TPA: HDOD domain-containing protein [Myxococcota bacterium]|nr:HDOD domain-containing protein [Myxococcota bacterium]
MSNELHTTQSHTEVYPDAETIMDRLERRWTLASHRPPLTPNIARQVVRMAHLPDVTRREAMDLFGQSPILTAALLREAQRSGPATSLPEAIEMLGLARTRAVLLRFAYDLKMVGQPDVITAITAIQLHGWRCARVAEVICRYTSLNADRARACALLQDIGLIAGLCALTDSAPGVAPPHISKCMRMLDAGHETLSWFVAECWGLPHELQDVLAAHHDVRVGGYRHPYCAVLVITQAVVAELGLDMSVDGMPCRTPESAQFVDALDALGLTEMQFLLIRKQSRSSLTG